MNKRRLTILRDALIDHATNPGNLRFDLRCWATIPAQYEDPEKAVRGAFLGQNFCGTAACAMGLAASIPQFNRAGLHLESSWGSVDVVFDGDTDFDAAAKFFQISWSDAAELFGPNAYTKREMRDPLCVADKITALLNCA